MLESRLEGEEERGDPERFREEDRVGRVLSHGNLAIVGVFQIRPELLLELQLMETEEVFTGPEKEVCMLTLEKQRRVCLK